MCLLLISFGLSLLCQRIVTNEQRAVAHFYEMSFARFDPAKNLARCNLQIRGGLVWREHQNFCSALFAPRDNFFVRQANHLSLKRLDCDNRFFFFHSRIHRFRFSPKCFCPPAVLLKFGLPLTHRQNFRTQSVLFCEAFPKVLNLVGIFS